MAVRNYKRYAITCLGLCLSALLVGCGKKNTYVEDESTSVNITETEETTEDVAIDEEAVKNGDIPSSKAGTIFAISDEEFVQFASEYVGKAVATDDVIYEEIENLKSMVEEGAYTNYYNSATAFMQAYTIPDTPLARKLSLYIADRIAVKDIPALIESDEWEYAYPLIQEIRVPETYLYMIALSEHSYEFSHKDNSIALDGTITIEDVEVVDSEDSIYEEAVNMIDYPGTIYRFIVYWNDYKLSSYVSACKDFKNRYLYTENFDKNPLTPAEQEEEFKYDDIMTITHGENYDEGAWDSQILENTKDETSEQEGEPEATTEESTENLE